jgi:hypothetical protein
MASIDDVVESYADHSRGLSQKSWQRFQRTRKKAPESALAEGIAFRVLQASKVDPIVADAGRRRAGFHVPSGETAGIHGRGDFASTG